MPVALAITMAVPVTAVVLSIVGVLLTAALGPDLDQTTVRPMVEQSLVNAMASA